MPRHIYAERQRRPARRGQVSEIDGWVEEVQRSGGLTTTIDEIALDGLLKRLGGSSEDYEVEPVDGDAEVDPDNLPSEE